MKSLLLFVLLSLVFTQKLVNKNDEETYGCKILEGHHKCCWVNNDGCCKPPSPGQGCTMAITTCCKIRVYDEETDTYKYQYTHHY